jgi:hypothetical protein
LSNIGFFSLLPSGSYNFIDYSSIFFTSGRASPTSVTCAGGSVSLLTLYSIHIYQFKFFSLLKIV